MKFIAGFRILKRIRTGKLIKKEDRVALFCWNYFIFLQLSVFSSFAGFLSKAETRTIELIMATVKQ